MSKCAKATFEVKSWDEHTVNEVEGTRKVTRATVAFAYQGDLVAESSMEYVMAYREDSSATVLGLERVSGRLDGKAGTFVLESHGSYANGTASGTVTIVEGSGTGELAGVHGHGTSTACSDGKTAFELEYEIR